MKSRSIFDYDLSVSLQLHGSDCPAAIFEEKLDNFEDRWATLYGTGSDQEETGPCGVANWQGDLLSAINSALLLNKPKAEALRYLQMQVETWLGNSELVKHRAMFKNDSYQLDYQVLGQTYTSEATWGLCESMCVQEWFSVFAAAVLHRRKDWVQQLSSYPESQFELSQVSAHEFDWALFRLFKEMLAPDELKHGDIYQLLVDAGNASKTANYKNDFQVEIADKLLVNLWLLIDCIYNHDSTEQDFQQLLDQALADHQQFFAVKDREFDPSGYMALRIMALAAIAHDSRGFNIDCSSPYMVEWLVKGDFND